MKAARGPAPAQLEAPQPRPAYTRNRAAVPCPRHQERRQSASASEAACSVSACPRPENGRRRRLPGSICQSPYPRPPRLLPSCTARHSRLSNHAIVTSAARSSALGVAASTAIAIVSSWARFELKSARSATHTGRLSRKGSSSIRRAYDQTGA